MYEGLPLTTNKIPWEERRGVPHHILGRITVGQEPWTVRQFRDEATRIIDEIRSRGRLPILVGGTHYYMQSLLFTHALADDGHCQYKPSKTREQEWPVLQASTADMLKELRKVDPTMAERWHPNDRRKIRRSLEICLDSGKKASEIYEQQQHHVEFETVYTKNRMAHGNSDELPQATFPLRYDTLVFWLYVSSNVLNMRLEKRVDSMVSAGLLEEVETMYCSFREQEQRGKTIDHDRGIWVAIGFKELFPYMKDQHRSVNLMLDGIECTKIATRQYAKSQTRWIRLRLQRAVKAANCDRNMFLLDATNSSHWTLEVDNKAKAISAAFLRGEVLPEPSSLSDAAKELLAVVDKEAESARYCEACDKTLMSQSQWLIHLKSKGHQSATRPKIDWRALYPKNSIG